MAQLSTTSLANDINLKGYWRLEGNSNDSSVNGKNGTDTAITYSAGNGKFGQGAGFDGSTSRIIFAGIDTAYFVPTDAHTLVMWFYVDSTGSGIQVPLYFGNYTTYTPNYHWDGFEFDHTSSEIRYKQYDGTDTQSVKVINKDQWYHIAGVHDGTNITLYVDGAAQASAGKRIPSIHASATMRLGTSQSLGNFFKGKIDDAAIFNRALSVSEIKMLVAVGTGRFASNLAMLGVG